MKNIKQIENIFWNFEKLNEEYVDLPETRKASEELTNFLIGNGMTRKEYMEIEDFISSATIQHEKQGFIYGFQYAIKLLFGEINEGRQGRGSSMSENEYEKMVELDDILFENQKALAMVECVQGLVANEVVGITGIPEHTIDYTLFKAIEMMRNNNERLEKSYLKKNDN